MPWDQSKEPNVPDSPPLKKRNFSLTLVATFLIGAGVGASLTYAALEAAGVDFSREGARQAHLAPDETPDPDTDATAPDETEAAPAEAPKPVPELLADVTGHWPGRHLFTVLPRGPLSDETLEWLRIFKPGGVVIRPDALQSHAQTLELVRSVRQAVGLGMSPNAAPLIIFDPDKSSLHNLGLDDAPSPSSLGAMNEESLAQRAGRGLGAALAERGFGLVIGPVLDVYEPGVSEPWLANLAFGAKPGLVAAIGLAYGEGIESGGVLPIIAHYPGLGHARYDDGVYNIPHTDLRALAELMFPFSKAAAESFPAILAGHAAVPVLDEDDPDRPAALSPVLVNAVIRDTWNYDGVVVADDVAAHGMTRDLETGEAVVRALAAGCDAVIVSGVTLEKLSAIATHIKEARRENRLRSDALNASQGRLDALQQRVPIGDMHPEEDEGEADTAPVEGEEEEAPLPVPASDEDDGEGTEEEAGEMAEEPAEDGGEESADETVEEEEAVDEAPAPEAAQPAQQRPLKNYTVQTGDNLRRIAEAHGTTVDELVRINNLESANMIRIGQRLQVPEARSAGGGP